MAVPTLPTDETPILRCARHPDTETVLRCGRCETPICPRCMVPTPVGARCPSCARVRGRAASLLKPSEIARACVYGIGAGALGTILLVFVPFLGLLGYAALGFLVGEVISIGVNRKRVRELGFVALACVVLGFEIGMVASILLSGGRPSPTLFVEPLLVVMANRMILLGLGLGGLLAWMRVR